MRLLPEALFLSFHLLDRTNTKKIEGSRSLEDLTSAVFYIALKYHHRWRVRMTPAQITLEFDVLRRLNFDLGCPGPIDFINRIQVLVEDDKQIVQCSLYILEITAADDALYGLLPSYTAAGAYCLSLGITKGGNWVRKIEHKWKQKASHTQTDGAAC